MQKKGRLQAVIEIYDGLFKAKIPMDLVIGDYMRSRRYIGSKDRAFIAETSYDIMRHFGQYDWLHKKLKAEKTGRSLVITHLVEANRANRDEVFEIFDGSKFAPKKLSDSETTYLKSLCADIKKLTAAMPEHIQYECPDDMEVKLREVFAADFKDEMAAFMQGASLDLRVNLNKSFRGDARAALAKDSIETDVTPLSPWGLRCRTKVHLAKSKTFTKGVVEIQDEGSQLISVLTDAQPGMQVLDYCAGGGGKTLGLSVAMQGKGRLVATDIDGKRLSKLKPRLKRAGLSDNVEVRALDEKRHVNWIKRQDTNFDRVLVDAPCSGTGTWRRNPDARWFRYGPSRDELIEIQADILNKVAKIPKVGGHLIYATCSILRDENEAQIEVFLKNHANYELLPLADAWPQGLECPDVFKDKDFMRLSPLQHGTDGFFTAVLKRVS